MPNLLFKSSLKIIVIAFILLINACKLVERTDIPVIDGRTYDQNPKMPSRPVEPAPEIEAPINVPNENIETIAFFEGEENTINGEIYDEPSYSDPLIIADNTNYADDTSMSADSPVIPQNPSQNPSYVIPPKPKVNEVQNLSPAVTSLLNDAQNHQQAGNLNLAASVLERAQRIAPQEAAVLLKLAEVRLAQNNPTLAEQIATRALMYASNKPQTAAKLWLLISDCRTKNGDHPGAVQAREQAQLLDNF